MFRLQRFHSVRSCKLASNNRSWAVCMYCLHCDSSHTRDSCHPCSSVNMFTTWEQIRQLQPVDVMFRSSGQSDALYGNPKDALYANTSARKTVKELGPSLLNKRANHSSNIESFLYCFFLSRRYINLRQTKQKTNAHTTFCDTYVWKFSKIFSCHRIKY